MDGEDAHGVVVGLGCGRLDDHRALVGLQLRPRHEVAERRTARLDERSGLIEHEAQPPPVIARAAEGKGELDELALADDQLDQAVDRQIPPHAVIAGERVHPGGDRMVVGDPFGPLRAVVVPPAAGDLPLDEVDVGAGKARRAERGDDRDVVGRVVDGAEHGQQLAHRVGGPHERAALDAVRHVVGIERALELRERRAGGHEDGDVVEPRGPASRRRRRLPPPTG